MSTPKKSARSGDSSPKPDAYRRALNRFWSSNLKLMLSLLLVWAVAGLGCGILFADRLNAYSIGGFPLGFWFAQQGSIIVFVFLILIYCLLMGGLDKKHQIDLQEDDSQSGGGI